MEFVVTLGWGAWALIIGAALVFGFLAQSIGEPRTGYDWLVSGIAFAIGATVASEFFVGLGGFEPVWDQLAIVPALVGGLIVGIGTDVVTRLSTGGTYTTHQPMSA